MSQAPEELLPEIELDEVVEEAPAPASADPVAIDIELPTPTSGGRRAVVPAPVAPVEEDELAIDIDLGLDAPPPDAASAEVPILPHAGLPGEPEPVGPAAVVPRPSLPSLDMDALFDEMGGEGGGDDEEPSALAINVADEEEDADVDGAEASSDDAFDDEPESESALDASGDLDGDLAADEATASELADEEAGEPAPPLPLSQEEPAPIPAIKAAELQPDLNMLATLKRLAGPGGDPDKARAALSAAIRGGSYDPRALPDARVIAIGIARALAQGGFSVDQLVDAMMKVLDE